MSRVGDCYYSGRDFFQTWFSYTSSFARLVGIVEGEIVNETLQVQVQSVVSTKPS